MTVLELLNHVRTLKWEGRLLLTSTESHVLDELIFLWNDSKRRNLVSFNPGSIAFTAFLKEKTVQAKMRSLAEKGIISYDATPGQYGRSTFSLAPLLFGQFGPKEGHPLPENSQQVDDQPTISLFNGPLQPIGTPAQTSENRKQIEEENKKKTAVAHFSKEQQVKPVSPRGAAQEDITGAVYRTFCLRGLVDEVALEETKRLVEYYGQRDWRSANGYDVQDVAQAASLWKRKPVARPASANFRAARPNTPQIYTQCPATPLPNDWQPGAYAKMTYLNQLAYIDHMIALKWVKVRPPAGTPPIIDRWFVKPETITLSA